MDSPAATEGYSALASRNSLGPYRIDALLGRGSMGVVFRATHAASGEVVALKTILGLSEDGAAALRREIHTLSRIHHAGVVQIVDQGFSEGIPWFAMHLLGGATARHYLASVRSTNQTLDAPLRFLARVCEPLAHLHERGIVHGDLKPENIHVGPGDQPVLVDFGLVARFGGLSGRETLNVRETISGTASYMSPEQIRGELIDARADIYALGCMFYETLTGRPPFVGSADADIFTEHLSRDAAPPSSLAGDIPPWLDDLVLRMLRKSRRERLGYADTVAAIVAEHVAIRVPDPRLRSCYLYRPDFVGRRSDLRRLDTYVSAARHGHGSVVLISGESGIGKTRLAIHASTVALERGLEVVLGECVPAGASGDGGDTVALHPFRPLLAKIADRCRQGGPEVTRQLLGDHGPVLAPYEPALADAAIGVAGTPLPDVSPEAALERLQHAMLEVMDNLAAEKPLLVILDDLQWADHLSLRILAALEGERLANSRTLILGTYRTEDGDALETLAHRFAETTVSLDRLARPDIHRMVGDMLGLEETPTAFCDSLFAHAEGNPFFVSEYLQMAVAERYVTRDPLGRWSLSRAHPDPSTGTDTLPVPETIQALVAMRLRALAPTIRNVLDAASILGTGFDERLLIRLARLDEAATTNAIHELIHRRLLDRGPKEELRFAHGKIREVTYASLPPSELPSWHERAAVAIEAGEESPGGYVRDVALAHHWSSAAQRLKPEAELIHKALEAVERAGEQAAQANASADAIRFFSDARRLFSEHPLPEMHQRNGRWLHQIGEAHYRLGNPAESRTYLEMALAEDGERIPTRLGGWIAALAGSAIRQTGSRIRAATGLARDIGSGDPSARSDALAKARTYEMLGFVQVLTMDWIPSLVSNLRAVNAAERLEPSASLAVSDASIGMSLGVVLGSRAASHYLTRALTTARRLNDDYCLGRVAHMVGFHLIGKGQWAEAELILADARSAFDRINDGRWRDSTILTAANVHYLRRRIGSLARYEEGFNAARPRADHQMRGWAALGCAGALLARGSSDKALAILDDMEKELGTLAKFGDHTAEYLAYGIHAAAQSRMGNVANAERAVVRANVLLDGPGRLLYYPALAGHLYVCEASFTLWEDQSHDERAASFARLAKRALQDLERFARFYPIGRPGAQVYRGTYWCRSGRSRRAHAAWHAAIAEAERLDMSYERGLAHRELGRHLPRDDQARQIHQERAREIFNRIDARHELAQMAGPKASTGGAR